MRSPIAGFLPRRENLVDGPLRRVALAGPMDVRDRRPPVSGHRGRSALTRLFRVKPAVLSRPR
ncbi:MAG TPA: hypothetical protein VFV05_23485 [Methylomirabilota bacterium]|nr:hypothetical protein [Methylomirabilota bacterium]